MKEYKIVKIKKIISEIEKVYGNSDLCSLLTQYAEKAENATKGKIKYISFFRSVRDAVVPDMLTSPEKIAKAVLRAGFSFTFDEISLFFDYAIIWALIELNIPVNSEKELLHTIDYLKALHYINPDEIIYALSEAERILSTSIYFKDSDENTKNICRRNVSSYAKKHSISEEEAAKILCLGNPLKRKKSLSSYLYFPFIGLSFVLLFVLALFLTKENLPICLFLIIPLYELAKQIADTIFSRIVKHNPIPKLKLSKIPPEAPVITVITSLLTSKKEVDDLLKKLLNCYFANKDENALFGLLCDLKESNSIETKEDEELICYTKMKAEELNEEFGCNFLIFIRKRHFSSTEGKYMGWERKRGAVIELTRVIKGKESSISLICGNREKLNTVKYAVTLDSDTRLYNGAIRDMLGAMLHPANTPKVENGRVTEGYGIMQPRMEASLESAEKTPFAILSSGNGGTDIYAFAAYETYQSIFNEGIFCGKGIFDVDLFFELIDGVFPDESILSHDLLEGARLRAAALTDISLTDNLPKNPLSCFDRQHRWIRGDIEALAFAGKYHPNKEGKTCPNPISRLSKYKLFDNVRRAFLPFSAVLALILSMFIPEKEAGFTILLSLSFLIFPFVVSSIFSLKNSGRRFFSGATPSISQSFLSFIYSAASLLHNAIISIDAILRAAFRMLFSRKHMLEWKTASEAEEGIKGLPLYLYKMLPSLLIGISIVIFCPLMLMKLIGFLWVIFPPVAYLIGKEFSASKGLTRVQKEQIKGYAHDIWRFFAENVTKEDSYLPPDNIQLSPNEVTAHRTSPTNIGLYLLSCLAACDFEFISLNELASRIKRALDSLDKMQRWHGHFYNWYDTENLDILGSPYVSTVDSGNFVTSLVALYYGLKEYDDGSRKFSDLIKRIRLIIDETDFSKLYDERKKLFKIGINTAFPENDSSLYDFFMSEARSTSFYAIARGQVPREHWRTLSRPLIGKDGYIGLASWSGTAFEYMMPSLLLPTRFGSLSFESLSFAAKQQKNYKIKGLFGISESGYFAFDGNMNYQYKAFGVPSLGIKRGLEKDRVISPYSSFLCLPFYQSAVLENLNKIRELGAYGRYGFYEAIDFTSSRVGGGHAIIRSYMSHHMGMSLIASANAYFGDIFVKRFMKSPEMSSSAELLEEKIPKSAPLCKNITRRRLPSVRKSPSFDFSSIDLQNSSSASSLPYSSVLSENGITVTGCLDMIKFSASGKDISVDPFVFGRIHRPRLFFSADGKVYDAMSCGMSRGAIQSRLIYRLDKRELMSEAVISISGKNRCFVISLSVMGHFKTLTPLFCFEPSLSTTSERESHPAYCDIMITAERLTAEGVMLYRRKDRVPEKPDTFIAVSLEGYGGGESYAVTRDILGPQYLEEDFERLFDKEFESKNGALINPFCAVKKESVCRSGKYSCSILISYGSSKEEALSSIFSTRREIRLSRKRNGAKYFASQYLKSIKERLIVSCAEKDFSKYVELMLTSVVLRKNCGKAKRTHHIGELWSFGISGDLPIFCLNVKEKVKDGTATSRIIGGFISAHKYLALCGIKTDLVIIYKNDGEYEGGQLSSIKELCEKSASSFMLGHKGGIFLLENGEEIISSVSVLYSDIDRNSTLDGIFAEYIRPVDIEEEIITRPSYYIEHKSSPDEAKIYGGEFKEDGFTVYKGLQTAPWSYVYAMPYFGTLLTQNSLGYTWIGNSHERRITPFNGDSLLDFSGERLILNEDGKKYDLLACASKVIFGRGSAVYEGSINNTDYRIKVGVSRRLPCKLVELEIDERCEVEYRVTPIMGEKSSPSRFIERLSEGEITRFIPRLTIDEKYDIGFLAEGKFGGKRLYILGAYPKGGEAVLPEILSRYMSVSGLSLVEEEYRNEIERLLPDIEIKTPDKYLNAISEYYLPYQALVCRFFGRTGFYQSGGAYGFRDQLQDCLSIMKGAPQIAKVHIIRCAAHQYEEGDVMHWWHSIRGVSRGVRTEYSDDYLWLPYVTAEYVSFTEDRDILDINIRYLTSPLLGEKERERYEIPSKSKFKETLFCHCLRAIERALTFGRHGLPYMGGGDWNDGMNRVGDGGGESVWLGFFLSMVLEKFIPIIAERGDLGGAEKYREIARSLKNSCEKCFSNGRFERAYYADGTPLGDENSIDTLPQAFSALSGANKELAKEALLSSVSLLFDRENAVYRLLYPAYDKGERQNPGYISAYPEGIRENGGQYTHAAVWTAIAASECRMNSLAYEILREINPAFIYKDEKGANRYRGEPYFLAGDVSANPAFPGRCGWSLYTGAAGWFYLAVIEALMGIFLYSDFFTVSPRLSEAFPYFQAKIKIKETEYTVFAALGEEDTYLLDGKNVNNLFYFDKNSHLLEITVEKNEEMR